MNKRGLINPCASQTESAHSKEGKRAPPSSCYCCHRGVNNGQLCLSPAPANSPPLSPPSVRERRVDSIGLTNARCQLSGASRLGRFSGAAGSRTRKGLQFTRHRVAAGDSGKSGRGDGAKSPTLARTRKSHVIAVVNENFILFRQNLLILFVSVMDFL
jgi:hypothetical protein